VEAVSLAPTWLLTAEPLDRIRGPTTQDCSDGVLDDRGQPAALDGYEPQNR